MEFREQVDCGS